MPSDNKPGLARIRAEARAHIDSSRGHSRESIDHVRKSRELILRSLEVLRLPYSRLRD